MWADIHKIEPTGARLQLRIWELSDVLSHEGTRGSWPLVERETPTAEVLIEKIHRSKERVVQGVLEDLSGQWRIDPYPSAKPYMALRCFGRLHEDYLESFAPVPSVRPVLPGHTWWAGELYARVGGLAQRLFDTLSDVNGAALNLKVSVWTRRPFGGPDCQVSKIGAP